MSNTQKPFYPQGENAGDKTGMRPISKQASEGKVIGGKITGPKAAARADRIARKSGGRIAKELANTDLKAANKDRKGGKDIEGGLKKGGAAGKPKKAMGGPSGRLSEQVGRSPVSEMQNMEQYQADKAVNAGGVAGLYAGAMRKRGGKVGKPSKEATEEKAEKKVAAPVKAKKVSSEKPFVSKDLKTKPVPEKKMMAPVEDVEVDEVVPDNEAAENDMPLKKGGRVKKWAGGGFKVGGEKKKAKKPSNKAPVTNIIIAGNPNATPAGAAGGAAVPPIAPGPRAPAPVVPGAAPGGDGPNPGPLGGPQPMPPMGAMAPNPAMPPQAGMPPEMLARKSGGRVNNYASLKAGAGSGLGRLKKAGLSV